MRVNLLHDAHLEEGTLNRTRAADFPCPSVLPTHLCTHGQKGSALRTSRPRQASFQSTGLLPNATPSDAGMGGLAANAMAIAAIAVVLASATAAAVAVLLYYWLRRKRRQCW